MSSKTRKTRRKSQNVRSAPPRAGPSLAAARRARAYTDSDVRVSETHGHRARAGGGESGETECTHTHISLRAVKTAALHAPHTGAQGAWEKVTETIKHRQCWPRSWRGALAAVHEAARDHPASGEDAERSACYRSARDRAWSGGDYYTGHGPQRSRAPGDLGTWSMWMRAPQGRNPGGRGRRRLGGRGSERATP